MESRIRTPLLATNRTQGRITENQQPAMRDQSGESFRTKTDDKVKSGMMDKSSMNVRNKLTWPQKQLGFRFIQEPVSFAQLTYEHLVVGGIATIRACTDLFEAKHRLRLLERVGYWKLRGADWSQVRAFYAAIVAGIEAEELTWDVEFHEFESMIIDKPLASSAVKPDRKFTFKQTKGKFDVWYRKDFNSEIGCQLEAGHSVITPKGDQKQAQHICAKCWKIRMYKADHAETSNDCPLRQ